MFEVERGDFKMKLNSPQGEQSSVQAELDRRRKDL